MPKTKSSEEARVSPTRFKNPQIIEMKSRKMAVVVTRGDPNVVSAKVLPALYGSVYKLKFQLKSKGADFKVRALCARWPDAHLVPKDQWTGIWGLQVPDDVTELPQKTPEIQVKLETWKYGKVAQILHLGPYSEEGPTVARLHQFIQDEGYQIAGSHEEEYLTRPTAKVPKTLIRYPIKKA